LYYLKKALKNRIKSILGLRTYSRRYDQLLEEIDTLQPRNICEIGVNDGTNAVRLIRRALIYRNDVEYYGFDLFESLDRETFFKEFAIKAPSLESVCRYLERNGIYKKKLFSGNTLESLPRLKLSLPKMDLVFIDGGHSFETVTSDWINVQHFLHEKSVVFFDDYPHWGVGPVVDSIDRNKWDVDILPTEDIFEVGGRFEQGSKGNRTGFKFARIQPTISENNQNEK
jgi:hypothetical protein